MVHPRQKMRRSNNRAVKYLLDNGFEAVWVAPHLRFGTYTHFKDRKVKGLDIFGIADGICVKNGETYYLQIKSNSWGGFKEFQEVCQRLHIKGLFLNVKDRKGVSVREVTPMTL